MYSPPHGHQSQVKDSQLRVDNVPCMALQGNFRGAAAVVRAEEGLVDTAPGFSGSINVDAGALAPMERSGERFCNDEVLRWTESNWHASNAAAYMDCGFHALGKCGPSSPPSNVDMSA